MPAGIEEAIDFNLTKLFDENTKHGDDDTILPVEPARVAEPAPVAEPVQPAPPKTNDLYKQLLSLEEDGGLIMSLEPFDCDICTNTIQLADGIILRNCLHRFCKECIERTIIYSEHVDIKCPYFENNNSCEGKLQDREIRAAVSPDDYDKYLRRGLRFARSTIKGTVVCNAADCEGWCICDEEINEFTCPQCSKINCVPCGVSEFWFEM